MHMAVNIEPSMRYFQINSIQRLFKMYHPYLLFLLLIILVYNIKVLTITSLNLLCVAFFIL
jgi:hypothetical protein